MLAYNPSGISPEGFSNCPMFLERYLLFLRNNQGKRPLTLEEAALLLREFCQYVHYKNVIREIPPTADAHKDMGITNMELSELAQVSQTDMLEYVSFLDTKTHNSEATIYKKLCIIRKFFAYLLKVQDETGVRFMNGNPTPRITRPTGRVAEHSAPHIEQMQRMINAVYRQGKLRDAAILLVLCTTGLTVSELSNITTDDILRNNWLRIEGNNGVRHVLLLSEPRKALRDYLASEEQDEIEDKHFLFHSHDSLTQPISHQTIRNIISRAESAAMLPPGSNVTPSSIRDAVADILFEMANAHEQANVAHYLGYSITAPYRSASAVQRTGFVKNTVMEDLVRRSPLASLTYR